LKWGELLQPFNIGEAYSIFPVHRGWSLADVKRYLRAGVPMNNKVDAECLPELGTEAELKSVIALQIVDWMTRTFTQEGNISGWIADLKTFVSRKEMAQPTRDWSKCIVFALPAMGDLTLVDRVSTRGESWVLRVVRLAPRPSQHPIGELCDSTALVDPERS